MFLIKFLHAADLHLDAPFSALSPEQAAERRQEQRALLQELAGDLLAGKTLDPDSLRDNLLHTIACKSAIKAGWLTSDEELRRLVQEVLSRDDIKYCPHGRPVCVTLTKRQLEKQFKRV